MNHYIFNDIVYNISYFDENLSKVLNDNVYKHIYSKLLYIARSLEEKKWYVEGKLHRIDGPAIESLEGIYEWYKNGKLHRDDGPAIEYFDGYKAWYKNGMLYRDDGPAIESDDGYRVWYKNGKRCRKDGSPI